MFKVQAHSLDEYFDADPARKGDLLQSTPLSGRRFPAWNGGSMPVRPLVTWPIVGLALQKNYISLYTSVVKDGAPITDGYKGMLGGLRAGRGNFSFVTAGQLNQDAVVGLLRDIDQTLRQDPIEALEYSTYPIVSSSVTAH